MCELIRLNAGHSVSLFQDSCGGKEPIRCCDGEKMPWIRAGMSFSPKTLTWIGKTLSGF
jgi:hypothetical protein